MMGTPISGRRVASPPRRAARGRHELDDPSLYLNRELSVLEFQHRVLAQARDPATPLLERLRFLGICSTNLDEFFEIRVSGLRQQVAYGIEQPGSDGQTPRQVLAAIAIEAHRLVDEQYSLLHDVLLPELKATGIELLAPSEWNEAQRAWIADYFRTEVAPVLTPMGLDPA